MSKRDREQAGERPREREREDARVCERAKENKTRRTTARESEYFLRALLPKRHDFR